MRPGDPLEVLKNAIYASVHELMAIPPVDRSCGIAAKGPILIHKAIAKATSSGIP
jgi:hypothetical protein